MTLPSPLWVYIKALKHCSPALYCFNLLNLLISSGSCAFQHVWILGANFWITYQLRSRLKRELKFPSRCYCIIWIWKESSNFWNYNYFMKMEEVSYSCCIGWTLLKIETEEIIRIINSFMWISSCELKRLLVCNKT